MPNFYHKLLGVKFNFRLVYSEMKCLDSIDLGATCLYCDLACLSRHLKTLVFDLEFLNFLNSFLDTNLVAYCDVNH